MGSSENSATEATARRIPTAGSSQQGMDPSTCNARLFAPWKGSVTSRTQWMTRAEASITRRAHSSAAMLGLTLMYAHAQQFGRACNFASIWELGCCCSDAACCSAALVRDATCCRHDIYRVSVPSHPLLPGRGGRPREVGEVPEKESGSFSGVDPSSLRLSADHPPCVAIIRTNITHSTYIYI